MCYVILTLDINEEIEFSRGKGHLIMQVVSSRAKFKRGASGAKVHAFV